MSTTTLTTTSSSNNKSDETINESTSKIEQKTDGIHNIKLGAFQLQTKSFWISIVSLLCLFVMIMVWMNLKTFNELLDEVFTHEEKMIQMIIDHKSFSIKN